MKRCPPILACFYLVCSCLMVTGLPGCASTPVITSEKSTANVMKLGTVWVDPDAHSVIVSGYINLVSGPVELLACGQKGKVHESILVLHADPSDLQAALLLSGIKHGAPMKVMGESPPQGDPVRIHVEWFDGVKYHAVPVEDLVLDLKTGKPLNHKAWIFNGSTMENGRFMAREEESMIATYWDPWAIINVASDVGRDDERLAVNRDVVPPQHTTIRVVISPAGK
jgi:hypothetical protein